MATNNTLRRITLIPAYGSLNDWFAARSFVAGLDPAVWQAFVEQGEHSPTLTHEAVAFEAQCYSSLGYDPRATAEIPTVPLPVDPESIELDPLPASEWTMRQQTYYARYHWSDLL